MAISLQSNLQSQVYVDPLDCWCHQRQYDWPALPEAAPWSGNKASIFADVKLGSTAPSSVQKCYGSGNVVSLSPIIFKKSWLLLPCLLNEAMNDLWSGGDKHLSNACWIGVRILVHKRLVVNKAPLSSLASKIQICVPSPWMFTWNKGVLLKLETNFCFKDFCRESSLQPSGIWRSSWILNFPPYDVQKATWSILSI